MKGFSVFDLALLIIVTGLVITTIILAAKV